MKAAPCSMAKTVSIPFTCLLAFSLLDRGKNLIPHHWLSVLAITPYTEWWRKHRRLKVWTLCTWTRETDLHFSQTWHIFCIRHCKKPSQDWIVLLWIWCTAYLQS